MLVLFIILRLRSSAWLEHWPFKPGVGGSNPLEAILKDSNLGLNSFQFINKRELKLPRILNS